jgi:hypothetical protein
VHAAGVSQQKVVHSMTLVIVLLLLALILGGIGLFVEAAKWLLIIALILFVVGIVAGFMGRNRSTV